MIGRRSAAHVARLALAALLAGPAAAQLDEQEQRQDAFIATVVLPGLRRGLGALVEKPWQVLDGSSLLFSAEFLLGERSCAGQQAGELRTWMYSQCISSGVGAEGSSLSMIYIGLENGEFMGYVSSSSLLLFSRKPQDAAAAAQYGEHKYTHRATGRGLAADLDLGSFSSLEELNACVLANRTTAATLPDCDPLREAECPACTHVRGLQLSSACSASGGNRSLLGNCTATCCDEDVRAYYRTSREQQGAAVALTGWAAYDHRLRPWYSGSKAGWQAQRQRHAWSDVYEFATSNQPGITATAAAVNSSGGLLGFLASDYELTEINQLLAESLEDADKWGLEGRVW